MKWLLLILGIVASLIALIVIIGWLLPRDHVARMTTRIAAPPDAVWATLTDPAGYPSWRTGVKRVELLPPTPSGPSWREHSSDGVITYVVDANEPPRRMVTRIAGENLPFGGRWEYRLAPDGDGATNLTIVERGSVYNPIFRFVSRFLMGHTATIDTYLRALGRKFGSESAPTPIATPGDSHGA